MRRTTDFDQLLGAVIRARRVALGLSQPDIANACGITFQQVQKYEHGTNRLSASRLSVIGRTLKTSGAELMAQAEATNLADLRPATPSHEGLLLGRAIGHLVPDELGILLSLARGLIKLRGATSLAA